MIDYMLENERRVGECGETGNGSKSGFESPTNYGVNKGERRKKRKKKEK